VDGATNALTSPLFVKAGATTTPTNNGGPNPGQSYNGGNVFFSVGGDYNCGGIPNSIIFPVPDHGDYSDDDAYYIAKSAFYRFLYFNDSVKASSGDLNTFYDDLNASNIQIFVQTEQELYEGDYEGARTLIGGVTSENSVDDNYLSFYSVYANYLEAYAANDSLSPEDSTTLYALTQLCPEINGSAVYQAMALYNSIYNTVLDFPPCSYGEGEKMASSSLSSNSGVNSPVKQWDVELFPNPANNQVSIVSQKEAESILIKIRDLDGRIIIEKTVKTNNFLATLELTLVNGAYLVTISNSENERTHKKLLIAK
jgi:hypothetical protein